MALRYALLCLLSTASADLTSVLQSTLDGVIAKYKSEMPSLVLQLGWTSSTLGDIAIASGSVDDGKGGTRNATGYDKMLFGSGTKPFTAAAVYRLAESGALSLDDDVAQIIDGGLRKANGTTMASRDGGISWTPQADTAAL